jgi:hypothetical protein
VAGLESALLNCVFGDRKGFVVGLKCAALGHRADLDSDSLPIDFTQDRLDHLNKKTRAIFQAAAVFVLTQIGGGIKKLRDQIRIVGQYLDTIEASLHRVSRSSREVRDRTTVGFRPVFVNESCPGSTFDADTGSAPSLSSG